MGEWLLSRRDRLIVARHEVPGSDAERPPSRVSVSFLAACSIVLVVRSSFVPGHTVPYGTALSKDAFPGTSCQATIGVVPTGRLADISQQHLASPSTERAGEAERRSQELHEKRIQESGVAGVQDERAVFSSWLRL